MQFSSEQFTKVRLESTQVFEGYEFSDCRFYRCIVEPRAQLKRLNLADRIEFRDCRLTNCTDEDCLLGPVILRRCVIDGLTSLSRQGTRVDGALLDQVTIKGRIDTLRFLAGATAGDRAFDDALAIDNRRLYEEVDWAVDITEASAGQLLLYGVPPELIRYDPTHQAIVRRSSVEHDFEAAIDACGDSLLGAYVHTLSVMRTADNVCFSLPTTYGDLKTHEQALAELRRLGFADEGPG